MDGRLSEEQVMLREGLQRYLADVSGPDSRMHGASGPGRSPDIWRAFAEDIGLLAAPFDESVGGLGGGEMDLLVIMEEVGRFLVTEPYLSTVVIAGALLTDAGREAEAAAIRDGSMTVAIAYLEPQGRFDHQDVETRAERAGDGWRLTGRKVVVRDGPSASHLLISARTAGHPRDAHGVSLFLVPAAELRATRQDYRLIDGVPAFDLTFDGLVVEGGALVGDIDEGATRLSAALDRGVIGLCAEAVGVMRVMLEQTVDYTKQREQFGRPLASFQVLQHRMVDMLIEIEQSQSITLLAANDPSNARAVSAAKARVGKALRFVSQNAVHLHGGIGTTAELDLSNYFRRAMVMESQLGSTDHHMRRYARLGRGEA